MTLHAVFAALLLAALLLPRRRLAAAGSGLAAYALGAGAFLAVPGLASIPALAARLTAVGLSPSFVGINVGLLLLGAGAVVAAGLGAAAAEQAWLPRVAGGGVAAIGVAALVTLVPLLRVAGLAAAGAAAALLAAAAALAFAGRTAQRFVYPFALRLTRRVAAETAGAPSTPPPRTLLIVAAAAMLAALAAPHALVVVAAALIAAVTAHLAAWRVGRVPAVPVLPIAALALAPFAWMLATIAGPVGLGTASLPLVPLSVPAQALLVPALVIGAWGFLGVWPLHRWVPGPILAPVAGALLLRVGAPALGAGFEHLQPLLFAAGAAAAWHAALTRRPAALLAALGVVATAAIFTSAQVAPGARVAAAALFAAAAAAAAVHGVRPVLARHVAVRAGVLVAGAAAYATIAAGLRAEVFLTVLVTAAIAAAAWRLRSAE